MTITIVIINPQTGNGAGVWMTSYPEEMILRIWGFWKRVSWDWTIEAESWVSAIVARVGYSAVGSWILTVGFFGSLPSGIWDITRWAARWDGVSIVRIVSLSLLVSPWIEVKKLIKPFVPETTESACIVFCICICICKVYNKCRQWKCKDASKTSFWPSIEVWMLILANAKIINSVYTLLLTQIVNAQLSFFFSRADLYF